MNRRDISLTLALCASLTLHALLLGGAAEWYAIGTSANLSLPGYPKTATTKPSLISLLPLPEPDDTRDPMDRLGDMQGKGKATADSAGDEPMQARKADQEQPLLSFDPDGASKIGESTSEIPAPLGQAAAAADAPKPAPSETAPPAPPAEQVLAMGVGRPAQEIAEPFVAKVQPSQSQPTPTEQPKTSEDHPEPAPASGSLSQPGAAASADAAPQGSTESDPFTTAGSVDFRRGAMQVRLGRNYKLTRPRFSLAAQSDAMSIASPSIILKLTLNESGNVISADVYRSSGSPNIDQPCQIAAYNWWFEPLKDKNGKPMKDVILFGLNFH